MKFFQSMMALVAMASALWSAGVAAQTVTFTKDAPLRAEPKFDASALTQVKRGTSGEAGTKQGPWLNITVQGNKGWALTTDIVFGTSVGEQSSGGGFSLGGLFGKSQTRTATTSTIGIRGFDPETIRSAMGDTGGISDAQLKMLDSFAANADAATRHARSQNLAAVEIAN